MLGAMLRQSLVWVVLLATSGCGSKGSVALSGSVSRAQVSVEEVTLGTRLTGGFDVFLELGPEATDGTTATLQSFALVAADGRGALVEPLLITPPETEFRLAPGDTRTLGYTLAHPDPVPAEAKAALCAGELRVVGAVTDTLSGGRTTPLQSSAFSPSGC
jgi:hypothetical protein